MKTKTIRFLAIFLTVLGLGQPLGLSAIEVSSGDIQLGEWNSNFLVAKQYAIDNHVPLVVFWGSSGCAFCNKMKTACSTSEFTDWQADCGMVLVHVEGTSTADGSAAKSFTGTGDYPRMRIYWQKADGTVKDSKPFAGRTGKMPNGGSGTLAGQLINAIKAVTEGYVPAGTTYYGGYFVSSNIVVTNGLTSSVTMRIEREDDARQHAATNWVVTALNYGTPITNAAPIAWSVGQSAAEFTYDFDLVGLDYTRTNVYSAVLLDEDRKSRSSANVVALPYPHKGGRFVTSSEPSACLQADAATKAVAVPVTRTSGEPHTQLLVISVPGQLPVTNAVVWAEGELQKSISIDLAGRYAANSEISLQLLDEVEAFSGATVIACVGEVENAPTNPYWLGERTAATLAWGEWTMDLTAATQKVAMAAGEAYALILVGGSKWCPDCVKTDRWLLDRPEFKAWAQSRQIACVCIDLPRVGADANKQTMLQASPSLLTYEPETVSDRYVQASADGEAARVQSGAGYLSRHNIPMSGNNGTNATAIAERNARLFLTGTDAGGLCRPDCVDVSNPETGKYKTGVPCLIVMDRTGRIIGRNFQFNNVSPSEFNAAYISRLDELLRQGADPSEESNDSRLTTADLLPLRGNSGLATAAADNRKSLSYHDINDWYRVDDNANGAQMQYRLSGDDDATVSLQFIRLIGNTEKVVAAATGALKDGLTLDIAKVPATNCYVKVSVPLSDGVASGFFALTNSASTVAKYVLTSDGVLKPTEVAQTFTAAEGSEREVTVELELGKVYKFTGNDGYDTEMLNYVMAEDVYVAKAAGTVVMQLVGDTFVYQLWNTGIMAFELATGKVQEPASGYTEHTVRVRRVGGVSSVGKVRVEVDRERSTELTEIYEFAQDGEEHTWAEGDDGDWLLTLKLFANEHSDGDQTVVLKLSPVDGTVAGLGEINEYWLTIADNDSAQPGRLAIQSVVPAMAAKRVYAQTGSEVEIALERVDGSDGELNGTLTASAGVLDVSEFNWKSRDVSVRTAKLSLAGVAAGTQVAVRLVPGAGTSAKSDAREFQIEVIAADAPEFVTAAASFVAYRRVAVEPDAAQVGVVLHSDGVVKVSKIAGQVPGGIGYGYDSTRQALVFTGATGAKVGVYTASFRIVCGNRAGTVANVTFAVLDPTQPVTETGSALNPACAVSRTFSDLQVYCDENFTRLAGLLTLTIPPSGRLSAKYVSPAGRIPLVAAHWNSIDGNGSLKTLLTSRDGKYQLGVMAFANGAVTCSLIDPAYDRQLVVLCPDDNWRKLDNGADDWQGYYTVSLAQRCATNTAILAKGDGYLTLRMTSDYAVRKGRMTYAGMLPNGRAFSGSRDLWGYHSFETESDELAALPVFSVSTADDACGLLFIRAGAADSHQENRRSVGNVMTEFGLAYTNDFIWTSKTGAAAGMAYEAKFDVFGGYYDAAEDFAECCQKTFETDRLTFFAMPALLDPQATWSTNDTTVSAAQVKGQNALTLLYPRNEQSLTLTFNRLTGIVSGSLELTVFGETVEAVYRGIVMPGWGTASCAECGDPTEAQLRPFVSGACWYTRYGCPFSIGVESGR